jgi:uncharacterized protein (DUF1778 family)
MGRPFKHARDRRTFAVNLRVTAVERERLHRAAALMSLSLSGWMRMTLLRAMRESRSSKDSHGRRADQQT